MDKKSGTEKVQLNVRISLALRRQLRHIAMDKGIELQVVVGDVLAEYVVRHQPDIERKFRGCDVESRN